MSEEAKSYREAAKKKAERLVRGDPKAKLDASGYTPPGPLDADKQTGPKPVAKRAFKKGGKVEGSEAKHHAGRAKREAGGMAYPNVNPSSIYGNSAMGNQTVKGPLGIKKGGRAERADGGKLWNVAQGSSKSRVHASDYSGAASRAAQIGMKSPDSISLHTTERQQVAQGNQARQAYKDGVVGRKRGGEVPGNSDITGTRPTGGRMARAHGGSAGKGKMNVNIIIADKKPDAAMGAGPQSPMPMPPPVRQPAPMGPMPAGPGAMGPSPVPPPMPMPPSGQPQMRAAGGRAYPIDTGSGGGKARIEKIKAYGA